MPPLAMLTIACGVVLGLLLFPIVSALVGFLLAALFFLITAPFALLFNAVRFFYLNPIQSAVFFLFSPLAVGSSLMPDSNSVLSTWIVGLAPSWVAWAVWRLLAVACSKLRELSTQRA